MPESHDIVYDENADIFYNDRYLEVLKEKDYVLELKPIYADDIIYEIVDRGTKTEKKKPSVNDEIFKYIDLGKTYHYAQFKHNMSLTKYMKPHPNYDDMPLSVSYILRKYCRIKLHNRNILIIHDAVFSKNRFLDHCGTLIDLLSLYFLENATQCNIYSIFPHPLSKNYIETITNRVNGNTYHMVNNANSGNILEKNVFDAISARLAKTVFDVVYFRAYNFNDVFNATLIYLHIITHHVNKNTWLMYYANAMQFSVDHYKIQFVLRQFFKKATFIKDKFLGISYPTVYMISTGFTEDKLICDRIKNIVADRTVFDKNIKIINGVNDDDIDHYINTICANILQRSRLLFELIRYSEPAYKKLSAIFEERIDIRQRALANKAKYAKYKI